MVYFNDLFMIIDVFDINIFIFGNLFIKILRYVIIRIILIGVWILVWDVGLFILL